MQRRLFRLRLTGVMLLAPLSACAALPQSPVQSQDSGPAAPLLEPFIERLFREVPVVPGMAVVVVRDTTVIYQRGFGVADVTTGAAVTPNTPFYIASSTKSFAGTAAAILDEKRVWDLDDPLARWVQARLPSPLSADSVTVRDLLTHASRLENGAIVFRTAYSGEHDRSLLLRMLATSGVRDPGFQYGNIGYVTASLAMDAAAGDSWKSVLEREIFRPLGMRRTSALRSAFADRELAMPHGIDPGTGAFEVRRYIKSDANMHAAGGIITTASDLAAWLEANINDGRLDGRQVLPVAAVREAQRLQIPTDARFHQIRRTGYGLGWYHGQYDGELLIHHFGNYPGFRAHVSFMPRHRIGVAVMTNESAHGYYMPEAVASYIYDRLRDRPGLEARQDSAIAFLRQDAARIRETIARDLAERALRPQSLVSPAASYAGEFFSADLGTMRIRATSRGTVEAEVGLLRSAMEPVDREGRHLRVELVPGSGAIVQFFVTGSRADSLIFQGATFRRVD